MAQERKFYRGKDKVGRLRDGTTVLQCILKQQEGVDWVHLSQDADMCQALVRTVLNLQISSSAGNL